MGSNQIFHDLCQGLFADQGVDWLKEVLLVYKMDTNSFKGDFMKRVIHSRLFFLYLLGSMAMLGCKSGKDKIASSDSYHTLVQIDTTTDVKVIIAKVNSFVMANKLDEAMAYLQPKLKKCTGTDKAAVLNEIGGVYFLKDDPDNAVANYLAASDLDPSNAQYLTNVAATYENLKQMSNAVIFAKKIMQLQNVSDSDKAVAEHVIERSSRRQDEH